MTLSPAFAGGRRGRGPLHARACNLILMRSGICPWRFWLRTCHFVPIDFYEVGDVPKFGEMTFYPGAGLDAFDPPEWDLKLGKFWPKGTYAASARRNLGFRAI